MRSSTIEKCEYAKLLVDEGKTLAFALKKAKVGANSYYEYVSDYKSAKVARAYKENPLIQSVLNSNMNTADKIEICAGLL
jgi:hypothetical protein